MTRPCVTLGELEHEGPPLRLRDLEALSGFSRDKLLRDIALGHLRARKDEDLRNGTRLVERKEARRYLAKIGACSTWNDYASSRN